MIENWIFFFKILNAFSSNGRAWKRILEMYISFQERTSVCALEIVAST